MRLLSLRCAEHLDMTTPSQPALTFRQALLAMLGISLVLMLSALDQTVIGNALPSIVSELNGFELYAWVATGYLLASIVTIPIFGRLGDFYGRKPFVLAATVIFTLASLLCALADSMLALVIGRALQGVGGGMLIGTAFACVPELFPDTRQRLRWQVLLSAMFSVVNAIGPGLGGYLAGEFGWRSVFWLNLPLGVIALFFAWRFLPWYRPQTAGAIRLDWIGAMLIVLSLGSLQLFVEWLGQRALAISLLCGVITVVAMTGLWFWERRCTFALLPAGLFANRSIRLLFIMSLLAGAIMFTLLFYLPLLLQGSYGYSPQDAGLLLTPLALSITLGAIVNSRIVTCLANPNWLPIGGFIALSVACIALALVGLQAGFATLLGLILLAGLGLGFILLNLTVFTQTLAERQFLGIATALTQSLRLVGGLLGTAAMGVLVKLLYIANLQRALTAAGQIKTMPHLADPQVLLQHSSADVDATLLLARTALAQAVGTGLMICAALGVLALVVLYRLPRVTLYQAPHTAIPAKDSAEKHAS
ncbi:MULTISPECIES: MFS transporter [Pseudomonas syringae group]|nr:MULTISPECIES: MFS transporter [Pseudomonas syringae group]KKI26485.1 DSBA oxidoreductase [Pseudomonas syringae pv. persicae]KTC01714.1 disulfide bond formation protein DsbA [Pseudomonas syringae ICMP 11292]MBF9244053.1 MFS transporter [Pseudomonas syringae pv. tomato]POD69713.1 MFS transporter [Pseudomonas syringae group genomosp. 3]